MFVCNWKLNVFFVYFSVSISLQSNFTCGGNSNIVSSRVSGGSQASRNQFPFHVAVFRDGVYTCGGNLISPKFVITVCHCVIDDVGQKIPNIEFKLLLGSSDLKSLTGDENVRNVEKVIPHPDYEFDKVLKQDIAMLKIKENVQFSSSISPICMFGSVTPIENHVHEKLLILGFGASEHDREPSRYLNFGTMSIISRQECIESRLIFGLLPASAFCAKAVKRMTVCSGDSGGGLLFTLDGKYYLRGISSYSISDPTGNCDPTQSVAFTDVSYFLDWIRQAQMN